MRAIAGQAAYVLRMCVALVLWASLAGAAPTWAADLWVYVSPTGDDSHTGQQATASAAGTNGPLKSLAQAQQWVRANLAAMRADKLPKQKIRVLLLPGEYNLRSTWLFDASDSGWANAPVSYEADQPGTVLVSGGQHLATLRGGGTQVTFKAPAGQLNAIAGGGQLFVQQRRAVLARMPDAGSYWFVEKPVALASDSGKPGHNAFRPEARAAEALATIPQAERPRAIVNVMSSWSAGAQRLVDPSPAGALHLKPTSSWPYLKYGSSQRFFVENVSVAWDKPGEWFWAADEIKYLLRPGEDANAIQAVLPMMETLVQINGQATPGAWVEYLRFKGIAFAHTRSLTPRDGFFDMQAAVGIGAAIEVNGARHVQFEGCEITHTGGYGFWLKKGVRETALVGNSLSDLGAGGIKIGLADQVPNDATATGNNTVLANTITDTGKVYPGAVGVWVGHSFDNEVAYNTIANTTYSGISVGWQWGYAEARSGRNKIVGNLLYNIGQGMLDDMGAIYTLGMAPGTVISDNLIREVRGYKGYGPGGWGIYLDEGSSGLVVENNVVVGTDSGGLHLHYGRANTVANNLFAAGDTDELLVTRSDPTLTKLVFQGNLLIPAGEHVFGGFAKAPDVVFGGNRVSSTLAGKAVDLAPCGKGCSVSAARLTTSSEVRAVSLTGAEPDMAKMVARVVAQAGKLPAARLPDSGPTVLIAPTSGMRTVATQRPPRTLAPARDFMVDFDLLTHDALPLELYYQPKDDVRAIRVVRGNDIPGGACLLFDDGPQFANRYDPHAFANLNFEAGEVFSRFAVRFDPQSVLIHEWRDTTKPYQTGPWLRITAKGVETHERVLMALNPGQWFSFEVSAPLGERAGVWRLSVSDDKGKTQVFDNLPVKSKGWKQLKWAGFISDASVKTEACIGQVRFGTKK